MAQDDVDDFLNNISQIESSGGKNFNHKTIQSGIQKGTTAIGRYGLMPNTVDEAIVRAKNSGDDDGSLDDILGMDADTKKSFLEGNPDIEHKIARSLASTVLNKQAGDTEKAAYAWNHGSNLSPDSIDDRDYSNDDYVKKFKKVTGSDNDDSGEFDPKAYLKKYAGSAQKTSDFDPKAYLAANQPKASEVSKGSAALTGAEQGLTFGFSDELNGGLEALGQGLGFKGAGGPIKDITTQSPNGLDWEAAKKAYIDRRDSERQKIQDAQDQHGGYYTAGQLGAGLLAPGAAVKSIKGAATLGAGLGGLSALGSSNSDLGSLDEAKDVAGGAAIGGVLGAGGQSIVNKLTPEALKESAASSAVKALGGKPYAGKMIPGVSDNAGSNLNVGLTALEQKALPFFGGSEGIQSTLANKTADLVAENAPVTAGAAQNIFNNPSLVEGRLNIAPKVEQQMVDLIGGLPTTGSNLKLGNQIEKDLTPLLAKLDAAGNDPELLEQVKREFQAAAKQAGAYKDIPGSSEKSKIYSQLANTVKDEVEKLTEIGSNSQVAAKYSQNNQNISNLIKAKDIVEKPGGILSKDLANPPGSLDFGQLAKVGGAATGVGLAAHNPLLAAGVVAGGAAKIGAEKLTEQPIGRLANIAAARSKYQLSKAAEKGLPQAVGAIGATGVQTGINRLYSSSPQTLKTIADNFTQDPQTKNLGTALNKAIQNDDQNAINTVTFAINQNPYARERVNTFLGKNEDQ